jgi:hypothetical protein
MLFVPYTKRHKDLSLWSPVSVWPAIDGVVKVEAGKMVPMPTTMRTSIKSWAPVEASQV